MSWSAWPTAGPPLPGVVTATAIQSTVLPGAVNSAPGLMPPATAAAIPAGIQYSPEQWAQMQQQNWQQWAQWQQQYQQWHQQYGAEYQKSINALAVSTPVPAPVAATNTAVPPPPPNENKPPPPPPPEDGSVLPGQYNTLPPKIGGGYTTAPPNQQYNTGPPPNFRQQPQTQWQNANNKRPLSQGEEYDGGKRQMLDNQGQWNKSTQPPKATGQQWQSQPPPSAQTHAQKVLNLEELTVAEKKFDKEFAAWEAQFNKWKEQNANHPDKTQYMEYEKKWESWRNSLLERREQMRKKRLALQASMATTAPPTKPVPAAQPQQSFNQPPPAQPAAYSSPKTQAPAVDLFSKPPPTQNNEPLAFKPPKGFPGEEASEQEGGTDFLKSSTASSGGIPGLDLVKEGQNQDLTEDEPDAPIEETETPVAATGPDLDAISKGINTILGDSKLLNMLSMVSQNQSFTAGNTVNTQPKMLDQPPLTHQPPPKHKTPLIHPPPQTHPSQLSHQPPLMHQPPPTNQPPPTSNPPIPSLLSMPIQRPALEPPNQNFEDYPDQYGPGSREAVNNFDDQTRMSFSNGPNDQDIGYGNNFTSAPPPVAGRPGRNDSFSRGENRNNFGANFNDTRRDTFDSFEGPSGNQPGFNRSGNNDNQGGGFNNRGFNRKDNLGNRSDNFNNRSDNFDNQNDDFDNRNDNFNNRRDNFNNKGDKFDRDNDYDDYEDRFNDNYDDYNREYDNQGFNNRRDFQKRKGYGDDYNEEGWEDDEYEKYHDMFNEGDHSADIPPLLPAISAPPVALPVPPPEEFVPPVEEEPLFVPEVVVDYEHKPLKEPEPEVSLDPIHMFDYRHKPVNRIPYPQRPIWLQGTLRNTRQFDPLGAGRFSGTDRQFDPLGAANLLSRDVERFPTDNRMERRPAYDVKGFRLNDDKYRDYRNRVEDSKFSRRPERDRNYGRDRDFVRDREINRYDNSPNNKEIEFRDRGRDSNVSSRNVRSQDRREHAYNEKKLDLEELSDDEWNDDVTGKHEKESLRFSPPRREIDSRSPDLGLAANPSNPSINTPVNQNITLEDLINAPGRYKRPPRIVIILRGPPGSGKTYLARLIKDREVENGGSAPRILSLDDYFMVEQEKEIIEDGKPVRIKEMIYEYEAEMEESYRQSLTKAFKKTVTDGYFNFIVVDNVNQKVKYFGEMWSYAKQNGFQVYICQMDLDPQLCTSRNIHNRNEADIEDCIAGWEPTPAHHPLVDATNFLQSCGPITEVEMEEVDQSQDDKDEGAEDHVRSKWDTFDCSVNNLARLDGVNKPLRPSRTMEEYLQLDDEWEEPSEPTKPGQKRVRWADLEEQKQQKKMKAIGFVVGQTDWKRMMDPSYGGSALTQTKFIDRVRRS